MFCLYYHINFLNATIFITILKKLVTIQPLSLYENVYSSEMYVGHALARGET